MDMDKHQRVMPLRYAYGWMMEPIELNFRLFGLLLGEERYGPALISMSGAVDVF